MKSESDLIRAAAAGDRGAFEELVLLKRGQVVRVAYQVTGDLEDAKDVAQGVFLRLFRGLGRFDVTRSFDSWLYRITMNAAIDLLRSRGPRGVIQPLPDDDAMEARGAADEAEAAVRLDELQRAFLRLSARLGPRQRAALVLREIEGLSTAEVARVLEVTESTIRNHLLQARRALKAGLESEYPGLVPGRRRDDGEDR